MVAFLDMTGDGAKVSMGWRRSACVLTAGRGIMKRQGLGAWLTACVLALSALPLIGAATALAVPSAYVFDPVLSLTGGCGTNADDEVPDPGCPYPSPPEGPSESFARPTGITTDSYGDVYVVVEGPDGALNHGHIDIFRPDGTFITEFQLVNPLNPLDVLDEPRTAAVDSEGYLYVYDNGAGLIRYDPNFSVYDPAAGEIEYETAGTILHEWGGDYASLAINPGNGPGDPNKDHLFVNFGSPRPDVAAIVEYGSAKDGNPLLDAEVAEVCCYDGPGLALDAVRGRLYATDAATDTSPRVIDVFELAAPHDLIEVIDGSSTPAGSFPKGPPGPLSLAVDESTGHIFAYDQDLRVIYELTEDGGYVSTLEHNLSTKEKKAQVAVDNGTNSPNGALNPVGRYVWVTSAPPGVGHAYAFKPTNVKPPEVTSVSFSEVSEGEALLEATIDTGEAETAYTFEYVSRAQFEASGFNSAQTAGKGTIAGGAALVTVTAEATSLSPGTEYVFRVIATNEESPPAGEGQSHFMTYPAITFGSCPNDALRIGPSAALPDCRAYELVTPPNTGGRPPLGLGLSGLSFPTLPASPDGNHLFFRIENGLIPGLDATGSLSGDPYLASRGATGWNTIAPAADGTEAQSVASGGRSPDQSFLVWRAEVSGPRVIDGHTTVYVRYPDGHSELLAKGTLGFDTTPIPMLVTDGGEHMLFTSTAALEEGAAGGGKTTVFDRAADGSLRVVSLLPGNVPPSAVQSVDYAGSSLDGRGVAFTVVEAGTGTLYLRYENETTYKIGAGLTFEGIAEGGNRIFYLKEGSLLAFDVLTGKTIQFAGGGDVTVANVSKDGSTAYLVSPDKLTSGASPLGKKAKFGEENLYRSREGSIDFIGAVSERDVEGEGANVRHDGLGLWADAVTSNAIPGRFAIDPSRTTDGGDVFLFQSEADLTNAGAAGHKQVYIYHAAANELRCISCNPTGEAPHGDALLQNVTESVTSPEPSGPFDVVENLSANGQRVIFQSPDPLVATDTDQLQDVYEWEAQGMGSCNAPGGCLYLISSGHSGKLNYLYGVSDSGDDVFFRTSDILAPPDQEEIPSIYDARVGGGFPVPPAAGECEGEGCRPQLTVPPVLPIPGSAPGKSGNVKRVCPKGKRKVMRHHRLRCVKKKKGSRHRHHRHHRHTNTKGRAS
jgi:hypothetical protein